MPLLEENSETNWIIDTAAKKNMFVRLLTPMTGSVVTTGSTKRTAVAKANPKAKGKAKGKAKAKASSTPSCQVNVPNLPQEEHVHDATIACSIGVRQKLWLDDLLACTNHVCSSVARMGVDNEHIESLKSQLIRTGLLFAMKGSVVLETGKSTKTHKKWSTLRPALKEHAMMILIQVRYRFGCNMM